MLFCWSGYYPFSYSRARGGVSVIGCSTGYVCLALWHVLVPHFITDVLVLEIQTNKPGVTLWSLLYVKGNRYLILNMDREMEEHASYWLYCVVYPSYESSCWLFILLVSIFQLFLTETFALETKSKELQQYPCSGCCLLYSSLTGPFIFLTSLLSSHTVKLWQNAECNWEIIY